MAKATGFQFDTATGDIRMNQGDTGSIVVRITRKDGETWDENARMLFTVRSPQGEIVMQRIYRLDDQWDLGDGTVLIEFHNDDTDSWNPGAYTMERRVNGSPIWEGTPSTARCVDALQAGAARMVEGVPVRSVFVGNLTIDGILGKI